jgi:hypothetical protein
MFTVVCDHGERASECRRCGADPALLELLMAVEQTLRRYLVMKDAAFTVVTVWVAHVFAFDAFEFTPYLAVTSATKRAGKSRLLEVLEVLLGPTGAISTSNISASSLFRLIDSNPGVAVLVDEIDRIPKERAEELWGLINSGWRITGKAHRQTGARMDTLAAFSTFSPKVLAGIGALPDTVTDRSIPIRMERRLPGEAVERLRLRKADAEVADIRAGFLEWANEGTIKRLRESNPSFPVGMTNDRLMDVAEPLFAIGDLAGREWPSRIREAVLFLEGADVQMAEEELGILALGHVYEAFDDDEKMSTEDLLRRLVQRDDGPWPEWWGDRVDAGRLVAPARRLGKCLAPFGVTPKQLRIGDRTVRGYELEPVREAVARYLPGLSATSVTSATPLVRPVAHVTDATDSRDDRLGIGEDAPDGRGLPEQAVRTSPAYSVFETCGWWTWEPTAGWEAIGIRLAWNQHGGLHQSAQLAEGAARHAMRCI